MDLIIRAFQCLALSIALVCALLTTGCQTMEFYGQAVSGQLYILNGRRPIEDLLRDPAVHGDEKARLRLALEIRKYAEDALALPVGDNYLTYVDLGRPCAAWNVFAAGEFSLEPYTWWYPLVGRLAYRGYFSRDAAEKYGLSLENHGYDVFIGCVPAYSTLGWFDDPVFSSFLGWPEADLADLIFHESAHRLLFAPGDTSFNEGFATTVGREGARRWLASLGKPDEFGEFEARRRRSLEFIRLVSQCRDSLRELYGRSIPEDEMRRAKAEIIRGLKSDYEELKNDWGGCKGYDAWFNRPINNARLLSVGAYNDLVPAFEALLKQSNGSLPDFYEECRKLAELSPEERKARLKALTPGSAYPPGDRRPVDREP